MKNSMVKMIKKVTATILAAATVMGATIAATPAIVRADDFNGIKLEELSDHPTAGMDLNVIKNAYKVGGNLGTDIESGTVAYINSYAMCALDGGTPCGKDIVVVYRTYTVTNLFGGKVSKVNCKSLTNGDSFDLVIDKHAAQLYELNKAQSFNDAGITVDSNGIRTNAHWLDKGWGLLASIKSLFS